MLVLQNQNSIDTNLNNVPRNLFGYASSNDSISFSAGSGVLCFVSESASTVLVGSVMKENRSIDTILKN